MAKNRKDENQLDLFGNGNSDVVHSDNKAETVKVEAVGTDILKSVDKKEENIPAVSELKAEKSVVSDSIQGFLKNKEESVTVKDDQPSNAMIEIVGQIKMDVNTFITNIPDENRFVSLSMHSDMIIITPIPEDGSITLKNMKEMYPTFVTQAQKLNDESILSSEDNMQLLDKLQTIVDGKRKIGKNLDNKAIENEIKFIDKLEKGEIELIDDEEPKVEAPVAKKSKLKM